MSQDRIKIEPTWKKALFNEFEKPYMQGLRTFLSQEIKQKKQIYPTPAEYFAAFNHTPIDKVKVVIIGQDPYHGEGQAHGLCFSVRPGVDVPPSLQNIFKELIADVGFKKPGHGCLTEWADQGVLLLNATLTVQASQAGSHQKKGWEEFTDAAIRYLNEEREHIVFMLWGSYAQKKGEIIDRKKHLVLTAPHPSPLSAHRGFLGCQHFSKANTYLVKQGLKPIDWQLSIQVAL
jgi:uracil-DNA glycosylase